MKKLPSVTMMRRRERAARRHLRQLRPIVRDLTQMMDTLSETYNALSASPYDFEGAMVMDKLEKKYRGITKDYNELRTLIESLAGTMES